MNWPVFFTRLGSAVIFTGIMLLGLMYEHPMAILLLAALVIFLCIKEFFNISKQIYADQHFTSFHFLISLAASAYLIVCMIIKIPEAFLVLTIIPVSLLIWSALSKKNTLAATLTTLISTLYIGLPIAMMVDLRNYAMVVPVGIVCLIWVNDTMAYITGSFIGRTTFTDISPKKTIEGTVGGIVFTMIIGWVFGSYMQDYLLPIHWMVIAGIVAIAGTLGDLLESQMKRKAGIKDSGNILPGHGGALDRFDSLLAVLPFVYLYFHSFANPHLL